MTIKEAQDAVDKWIKQYGVRYFSELTNMACLTEEVGELARVIARTYGDQSFKREKNPTLEKKWPMCIGYLYVWQIKRGSTLRKSFKRASTRKPKEMQKDIKTTLIKHRTRKRQTINNNNKNIKYEQYQGTSYCPEKGQYSEMDDKYLSVLKQYNCDLNDEEVAAEVKKILDEKVAENETMEVKKFLFGSIELTSLHTEDTEESILKMIEKVNQFAKDYPQLPHVATVCTYPNFAGLISQSLEVDGVEIAVVSGNFPSSQTFIEVKIAETAMAIKDGATEVDIVMPVGKFFSEDYEGLCDDIQELKETCGEHKMKCILETGCLKNCSNIMKASILAMYSGSDYIKTSTGKEKISATPEAAYVMCQAIKAYYEKTGIQIGFKPAGGINTVHDAVVYYTIVKEVLGENG